MYPTTPTATIPPTISNSRCLAAAAAAAAACCAAVGVVVFLRPKAALTTFATSLSAVVPICVHGDELLELLALLLELLLPLELLAPLR